MSKRGFTLIELLVVISIIALLASVVLAAVNSARDKAATARARQDLYQFAKAIVIAQGESNKTLYGITGSGCSDCSCRTGTSLKGTTTPNACNWGTVMASVQSNSNGLVSGLTNMATDPWGSPYCVDENQGESGIGSCGNSDGFRSVGPNGIWGDSDDIFQSIPLSAKCP